MREREREREKRERKKSKISRVSDQNGVSLLITICDALPQKVHKVAGSERRYTP